SSHLTSAALRLRSGLHWAASFGSLEGSAGFELKPQIANSPRFVFAMSEYSNIARSQRVKFGNFEKASATRLRCACLEVSASAPGAGDATINATRRMAATRERETISRMLVVRSV